MRHVSRLISTLALRNARTAATARRSSTRPAPRSTIEAIEGRCLLAASIATDLADYAPGSTAHITGAGFAAGETVTLQVQHAPGSRGDNTDPENQAWSVVADADGNVVTAWSVTDPDAPLASYILTAVGGTSGESASHAFTDLATNTPTRINWLSSPTTINPGTQVNVTAQLEYEQMPGKWVGLKGNMYGSYVHFAFRDAAGNVVGTPVNVLSGSTFVSGVGYGSASASMTVPAGAVKMTASYVGSAYLGGDGQQQVKNGAPQWVYNPTSGLDKFVVTGASIQSVVVNGVAKDVLVIVGTNGNDTVRVERSGITNPASGKPAWRVTLNGVRSFYDVKPGNVRPADGLYVTGGAGDDTVMVQVVANYAGSDDLNVPTALEGGDGKDVLWGGKSNSLLVGGAGADVLHGYDGNDVYVGSALNAALAGNVGLLVGIAQTGNTSAMGSTGVLVSGSSDFVLDAGVDTYHASKGYDAVFARSGDVFSNPYNYGFDWVITI